MKKYKTRNTAYENFIKDLVVSIDKYGEEHVDIIMDTEKKCVYIGYHNQNNSFNISEDYPIESLDFSDDCPIESLDFIQIADDYNVGWSEL